MTLCRLQFNAVITCDCDTVFEVRTKWKVIKSHADWPRFETTNRLLFSRHPVFASALQFMQISEPRAYSVEHWTCMYLTHFTSQEANPLLRPAAAMRFLLRDCCPIDQLMEMSLITSHFIVQCRDQEDLMNEYQNTIYVKTRSTLDISRITFRHKRRLQLCQSRPMTCDSGLKKLSVDCAFNVCAAMSPYVSCMYDLYAYIHQRIELKKSSSTGHDVTWRISTFAADVVESAHSLT